MQARQYDEDEIRCAISYEIIRHPIRIYPSEKVYELASLLSMLKSGTAWQCPVTKRSIQALAYDTTLKSHLDTHYSDHEDRHGDYRWEYALARLVVYMKTRSAYAGFNLISAAIPSLVTTGVLFSLFAAIDSRSFFLDNKNLDHFLCAAALGITDIVLRHKTNNEIGLFSFLPKVLKSISCCTRVPEEDEELDIMDLRI